MFGVPGPDGGPGAAGVEQAEGAVVGVVPQAGVHPVVQEVSQYGVAEDQGAGRGTGADQVGAGQGAEGGGGTVAGVPGHVRGVTGAKGLPEDCGGGQHLGAVAREGLQFGEHRRRGAQQRACRVRPRRPLAGVVARRQQDAQGARVAEGACGQLFGGPAACQGGDGRRVQRSGFHADQVPRVRGVVQGGEQGGRRLPGPQGESQDQRVRGAVLGEGFQQPGRGGIRVVEVVQHEHAPAAAVPARAAVEQGAYQLVIRSRVPRGPGLGGGRTGAGRRGHGPFPGVAEDLVRLGLTGACPGPEHGCAPFGGEPGEQVQQGGLSDAGVPGDLKDRAPAGAELLDGPGERGGLLPPPRQCRCF
ncbi:hypothetical protein SLAV_02315 [Streptomyces lavendulae subsp. lavendulae]|uniref:Uncharacterized protein n=1 Tax=Streptomyces lavendulae subsp. lavendulae TaxID=58340 RepID=A0A2K8P6L2_STRLA|nr:hypothetical protein SLAV_02315 [Streptomyces lavendulae subsp. lavendulae]